MKDKEHSNITCMSGLLQDKPSNYWYQCVYSTCPKRSKNKLTTFQKKGLNIMQKAANQRFEFLQKIGKSVAASASGLTIWKKKKKGN